MAIDEGGYHIVAAADAEAEEQGASSTRFTNVAPDLINERQIQIVNSITKELGRGFQHIKTSNDLWIELNRRFGRMNGPRSYKLQRELATYSPRNQSGLLYYNNLQALWDKIHLLVSCNICTCGAAELNKHNEDNERLMQFLMGLSDSYEFVLNQILILVLLPSVSQAYNMIIQVEDQKDVSSLHPNDGEHNTLYSNQRNFRGIDEGFQRFKSDKLKTRANFIDEEDNPSVKDVTASQQSDTMSDMSKIIQAEVAKYIGGYMQKSGNVGSSFNIVNLVEIDEKDEGSKDYIGHYTFGIKDEIHQNEWIIHSRAIIHMCCNAALMHTLSKMKVPKMIFLPDGSSIEAHYSGEVRLSQQIILHRVLYASSFTHNLISVGELTKDIDGKTTIEPYHLLPFPLFADSSTPSTCLLPDLPTEFSPPSPSPGSPFTLSPLAYFPPNEFVLPSHVFPLCRTEPVRFFSAAVLLGFRYACSPLSQGMSRDVNG
ncbi:hypothetical protein C2S52_006514 [Perilla frutescens var. hirtella]|nr:hypothetical protein C2S52_006514 [Perilla frutescens var. hirtella]